MAESEVYKISIEEHRALGFEETDEEDNDIEGFDSDIDLDVIDEHLGSKQRHKTLDC